jgi:hypothetical protein
VKRWDEALSFVIEENNVGNREEVEVAIVLGF